jgi:galactan beta-1,4-galactosyltransferase
MKYEGGDTPFAIPPCVDIKSSMASLTFLTLVVAFWQLQPYGSLLTMSRTSATTPCTLFTTTAAMDLTSPNNTDGTATNTNQPPPVSHPDLRGTKTRA